uniref:AAA+ ATPase domain-containing protein n=1 Tax=Hucho hucho TaxID=62062 RepID=A0A4W5LI94_9TELE
MLQIGMNKGAENNTLQSRKSPLAERIRPQKLEDYISQSHLVGPNGSLTQQIAKGIIPSLILWGPPGTGKTTLAQIIAQESKRPFYILSAINSGVKDIRDVIEKAKQSGGLFTAKNPILFIDEIHRFSKSQQDSLLAAVEKGWITYSRFIISLSSIYTECFYKSRFGTFIASSHENGP